MLEIRPTKVVGVGRNYADHAKELGNEVPSEPLIFLSFSLWNSTSPVMRSITRNASQQGQVISMLAI